MARSRNVLARQQGARGGGFSTYAEADFSLGMKRDAPRAAIPPGGVYNSVDYLLHQPGIAIKRGGTSYAGPALGADSYAKAVVYAEFPAGAQLVALSNNNNLYKVTAGTTTDLVAGGPSGCIDKPKLRVGGGSNLLIIPQDNGTSVPLTYNGAACSLLGGGPAAGKFCAIYKTRLVLGNSNANPNRLYFSPTPDIASTWDTTNSWIDCDNAITGLASLRNSIIIFGQSHTEKIVGSTPPPNSDMDRSPIGDIGCTDARSIVVQEGNVLFANPRGVYLTNGAGFASLTTEGGIETYWQSLFASYNPTTWVLSAGVYRSFYLVFLLDSSGALVDGLMCYVPRRAWMRLSNIRPMMLASAIASQEELYYADRGAARVTAMSGVFSPTSGTKNDANGTAVAPVIEFRMLGRGTGLKQFGFAHLSFDMRDAASDNPTMAVQVAPSLEATTYASVAESPLSENTDETRQRVTIGKVAQGVNVKLTQTNASSKTEIYALEYEERPLPIQAGGQ